MQTELFSPQEQDTAFGCAFCITGKEHALAELINRFSPGVRAIVARKENFHSEHGVKTRVEKIILPGYVFFRAPKEGDPDIPRDHLIRVLTLDDGDWRLAGDDERFAEWLFQYGGLLGFSKAYREGDRIKIVDGPLKDMEGQIQRVDKRGHSGQVALEFNGHVTMVWLGFDLIDPLRKDV